jgi:tRNA (adenine37-N6)-methyltransferase
MSAPITYQAIGTYHSAGAYKANAPVQSGMDDARTGEIRFASGLNLAGAFDGYQADDRIWVLYHFHAAKGWKAKVRPPRWLEIKIGLFATRSPHRPNPIGLSSLKLVAVDAKGLTVSGGDLIDGTPVLDIKPYLDFADAHAGCVPSWYKEGVEHTMAFEADAQERLQLLEESGVQLEAACASNLKYPPLLDSRKRIREEDDGFIYAYRTWRVHFTLDGLHIQITGIQSGYSEAEMADPTDPHGDKALHRRFRSRYAD